MRQSRDTFGRDLEPSSPAGLNFRKLLQAMNGRSFEKIAPFRILRFPMTFAPTNPRRFHAPDDLPGMIVNVKFTRPRGLFYRTAFRGDHSLRHSPMEYRRSSSPAESSSLAHRRAIAARREC